MPVLTDIGYLVADPAGTPASAKLSLSRAYGILNHVCQGRLTLTSGTAVTTADVTAATSVYFTPCGGQCVALYDGTRWRMYTFTELTLALGTLTSGLPYDVFLYDNSGTLTLELLAWTNGTTRATALALTNGVYLKTGALTRRYLGTFYTTATTTTEDSETKRFLWNYYHRRRRKLKKTEPTDNWSYNGTFRNARAQAANKVEVVIGVAEAALTLRIDQLINIATANYASVGIGIGSSTVSSADTYTVNASGSGFGPVFAHLDSYYQAIGYQYYQWIEEASGASATFYSDGGGNDRIAGLLGWVEG